MVADRVDAKTFIATWRVFGDQEVGPAHQRSGQPIQDDIGLRDAVDGVPDAVIVAVADGHGGALYVRSEVGARLAVQAAREQLQGLAKSPFNDLSGPRRAAEERLPTLICLRWSRLVEADLTSGPLTVDELRRVEARAGATQRRLLESRPELAYGSTLLAFLATSRYVVYLQLGDGEILTADIEAGVYPAFARDPRFLANETASLVSPNPENEMRVKFEVLTGRGPAMILAVTDGFGNAFTDRESLTLTIVEALEVARDKGGAGITRLLRDWVTRTTERSGDDASVGLAVRAELVGTALVREEGAKATDSREESVTQMRGLVPRSRRGANRSTKRRRGK